MPGRKSQEGDFLQRAALYIRVSTEEQAQHGYSLGAQIAALDDYAKRNDYMIVDHYIDDGFSARKKYTTRKEFMRMLEDVKRDKIDIILFIKLDRWFRSVKDYYEVQSVLEAHNVHWKAVLEDYDTLTSGGQLHINIMLSVAQNESDRTSERIKFVLRDKERRKEPCMSKLPYGLKIENKQIVPANPQMAEMLQDLFLHYESYSSVNKTMVYAREKYDCKLKYSGIRKMLSNRLYRGEYHGIQDFCDAVIDKNLFDRVQDKLSRNISKASTGRVYIFTSLLTCGICGHNMVSQFSKNHCYYRCRTHRIDLLCPNAKTIGEKKLEAYLLANVRRLMRDYIFQCECSQKKAQLTPIIDKAKIRRKVEKLRELYVNELIDLESYRKDYDLYTKQLQELPPDPPPPPDTESLRKVMNTDFESSYVDFSREQRRVFWRGIIRQIIIDDSGNVTKVLFL